MESSIVKKAKEVLKEKKVRRRWMAVVAVLAVAVVGATAWSLMSPARAMIELYCDLEEHVHSDECYELVLSCGHEEEEETVAAAPADSESEAHQHDDGCYDYVKGTDPVCAQEETEGHTHTDDCYIVTEERNLSCEQDGVEGHEHTDECYTVTEVQTLNCGQEETEGHSHTDDCYEVTAILVCDKEESDGAEEQPEASVEISEVHEHTEECYEKVLVCGIEEHEHTEECYKVPVYYCVDRIHSHTEECYEEGILICGQADFAVHTHNEDCFDLKGNVICPLGEVEEHEHTDECYDQDKNLICGKEEILLHTHSDACRDEKGALICGQPEILAHVHSEECTVEIVEEPKAAEGGTITKVYEGFAITAVYGPEAKLPGDVRLVAEQITAEMDAEHYAAREAEYQAEAGEDAVMHALLKVGFYVNGREVEPEGTVTITVQFLDENGLPEGSPVTVVHFGKNGTEVLNGTDAESSSTTFEMNSFSEIAIGYGTKDAGQEEGTVYISETYEYEDNAFHIDFHVEGTVTLPVAEDEDEKNAADSEITEQLAEETAGEESDKGELNEAETDGAEPSESEEDASELGLEFKVDLLEEESDEYADAYEAVTHYAENLNEKSGLVLFKLLTYSLVTADGEEVDLSECNVRADITPLVSSKDLKGTEPESIADGIEDDEDENGQEEIATFSIMAFELSEKQANMVGSVALDEEDEVMLSVTLDNGILPLAAIGPFEIGNANPKFTVQYYAYLDIVDKVTSGGMLTLIDTSGRNMPTNAKMMDQATIGINLDSFNKVATTETLTEVYKINETYKYVEKPSLQYVDILADNPHYELSAVWVLKSDNAASTEETDWVIHPYSDKLFFTNKTLTAEEKADAEKSGYEYVEIIEGTIIRLVYIVTEANLDIAASFYDYDISDGKVYRNRDLSGGYILSNELFGDKDSLNYVDWVNRGSGNYYISTEQKGINSPSNYSGTGVKLAFGNVNAGTTLGNEVWNEQTKNGVMTGQLLNQWNGSGRTTGGDRTTKHATKGGSSMGTCAISGGVYAGCTFGLVSSLNSDGTLNYADGVIAPKLFNESGTVTGKTTYDDYSLKFNRIGDTYTLTAVNGTPAENLDAFDHPRQYSIWTNNFWPMDSVPSCGGLYEGVYHDIKFGGTATFTDDNGSHIAEHALGYGSKTDWEDDKFLPESDDGLYHNSYFGMHYEVAFDLTKEYVGPLEYYFFGDDDMWVFLSEIEMERELNCEQEHDHTDACYVQSVVTRKNSKLVCDIGGVHSSVGEYVDLWDYIDKEGRKENKKYALSFFYTERGASGSTCWMQFTLPSVITLTPETSTKDYGKLQIEKEVKIESSATGNNDFVIEEEEFIFKLTLTTKKDGNVVNLPGHFSYTKTKNDGTTMSELVISSGTYFTLKNGEKIVIDYLPNGTDYTIEELDEVVDEHTNLENKNPDKPNDTVTVKDSLYNYVTEISGDTKQSGRTVSGTITSSGTGLSVVKYTNKLDVYKLPETGGPGSRWFMIAGGLCMLLGAGLLGRKSMKYRKQIASILLAVVMILGMGTTASAMEMSNAETNTASNTEAEGRAVLVAHTYELYQIFTGTYSNGAFADLKWGANGKGKDGGSVNLGDLVEESILKELQTVFDDTNYFDTEQLAVINKYVNLGTPPFRTNSQAIFTGLTPGYYLIKDKDDSLDDSYESYTLYVAKVVDNNGTLTFKPKSDKPTVDKNIIEGTGRVKVNEASIGDIVTYEITGTLPDNIDAYNTYYYVFEDVLSKGLTYVDGSIKVEVDGKDVTSYFYGEAGAYDAAKGTEITVGIQDLKALNWLANPRVTITKDTKVVVTYEAILNENALLAPDRNPNTVDLVYSNDPNRSGSGATTPPEEDPDKPEPKKDPDNFQPVGRTPKETVYTYTTQLTIFKVDEKRASLPGVEFTLTGESVNVTLVSGGEFVEDPQGTYWKLKDGTYTTIPPTSDSEGKANIGEYESTETKYSIQDSKRFIIYTETEEQDGAYRRLKDGTYVEKTRTDINSSDYDADGKFYAKKVVELNDETTAADVSQEINSGNAKPRHAVVGVAGTDGKVIFTGLGAGTYTITETKTPVGYNTIDPIEFTIEFIPNQRDKTGEFRVTDANNENHDAIIWDEEGNNTFKTTIVNQKGTLLPSTGGMGTKIFYVGGGILVAAAVVLLVMKNRKSIKKEEE